MPILTLELAWNLPVIRRVLTFWAISNRVLYAIEYYLSTVRLFFIMSYDYSQALRQYMRRNILHEGSGQLTYEIREIVKVGHELQQLGVDITWENIGDPIQKGEKMPLWIKNVITELAQDDKTYGYVATQGVPETRG
ncbi:hypothetical protein KAR91_60385, partial [Candidatus Pacearchaeota archaeon]|nr:hypothetical protein [Candidatus Pacearchaeota archaeon]